jgi:hypothetical protein
MDPLFWILAGIVVGCVIGIVILWRLEARAERRLAIQRAIADRESARLKALDPLAVIERADTRPIPAPPELRPSPAAAQRAAPASPVPTPEIVPPESQPSRFQEIVAELGAAPLPEIHILQRPPSPISPTPEQAEKAPPNGTPAPASPAPGAAPLAPAGRETGAALPTTLEGERGAAAPSVQELLQTTPERARLRAAELAREERALEEMLEANRARLEQCLHSDAPLNDEQAAAITLLRSEVARQRERLLELIFLEQSYQQIAAAVPAHPAQPQQQAAPPNTTKAFGVRRHSLARVEPPGQDQPGPDAQATPDTPT